MKQLDRKKYTGYNYSEGSRDKRKAVKVKHAKQTQLTKEMKVCRSCINYSRERYNCSSQPIQKVRLKVVVLE